MGWRDKLCAFCGQPFVDMGKQDRRTTCSKTCRYKLARQTTSKSEEYHLKLSLSKLGPKNPMWVGGAVRMEGLHDWVKRHFAKPEFCQDCNEPKPLDLANISQQYKRDLDDWEWLCRRCHMLKDGRLQKLRECDKRPVRHR